MLSLTFHIYMNLLIFPVWYVKKDPSFTDDLNIREIKEWLPKVMQCLYLVLFESHTQIDLGNKQVFHWLVQLKVCKDRGEGVRGLYLWLDPEIEWCHHVSLILFTQLCYSLNWLLSWTGLILVLERWQPVASVLHPIFSTECFISPFVPHQPGFRQRCEIC